MIASSIIRSLVDFGRTVIVETEMKHLVTEVLVDGLAVAFLIKDIEIDMR